MKKLIGILGLLSLMSFSARADLKFSNMPHPKGTSIVIAASNSTLEAKTNADYVCTGTGDQSTINTAIASLVTTGGTVLLRNGVYKLSNSIIIDQSHLTLEGEEHPGWGGYIHSWDGLTPTASTTTLGTVIDCSAGGFDGIVIQHNNVPDGGETRHRAIAIRSLYILGPGGPTVSGSYLQNAMSGWGVDDWCEITDCYFQRWLNGISGTFDSPTIAHNSFQDDAGTFFTSVDVIYMRAYDNLIYDIGGDGFHLTGGNGSVISGNPMGDLFGHFAYIGGSASDVAFNTNNFSGFCNNDAIVIDGVIGCTVSNNIFSGYIEYQGVSIGPTLTSSGTVVDGNSFPGTSYAQNAVAFHNGSTGAAIGNSIGLTSNFASSGPNFLYTNVDSVAYNSGDLNLNSGNAGPASITTAFYMMWYKADSISISSGVAISSWTDSTGFGYTMLPVSGSSPTFETSQVNGYPAVHFNGTSQFLRNSSVNPSGGRAQPYTIYAVIKQDSTTGNQDPFGNNGGSGMFINSTANYYAGAAATGPSITGTNWNLVEACVNGSNTIISVNGTANTGLSAGTNFIGTSMYLGINGDGSSEKWNGFIAEEVILSGIPSASDRALIRTTLETKYGISGS
jgi:hypothetical protein